MRRVADDKAESSRIMLALLDAVERDLVQSQRHLASELGIALGLVNAYLKRCMKKGLVKVRQAPARRYAYYLTPQGFTEKSRLTVDYLSMSFSFFRRAKADCAAVFALVKERRCRRAVLAGKSDLAEIAVLCAAESGIEIVAIVDPHAEATQFVGLPLVRDYAAVPASFDVVVVTDVTRAGEAMRSAVAMLDEDHVFAPALLGLRKLPESVP